MPKTVFDLTDDPYRSLSSALKRVGGYAKNRAPFSEFRWANFLRHRIARETVERDFDHAQELALVLAQSRETITLPGWLGPASTNAVRCVEEVDSLILFALPRPSTKNRS
jgi:hypothetical protein